MRQKIASGVVDHYHGVPVADPFRWLEDPNSAQTRRWTQRQRASFVSYMSSYPPRTHIRAHIQKMLDVTTVESPWEIGNQLFYLKRNSGQEQSSLMLREGDSETTLVDPNDGDAPWRTVQILQISSNGDRVAYGEKLGGEDTCSVRFLDVATRSAFHTGLPRGYHRGITFGEKKCHFYHAHEYVDCSNGGRRSVWRRDLNSGEEEEVFCAGTGSRLRLRIIPGSAEDWMAYMAWEPEVCSRIYLHNPSTDTPPRIINEPGLGEFGILRIGPRCWVMNRQREGGCQIVAFDARYPEKQKWEIIVPHLPDDMTGYTMWQDSICITHPLGQGEITTVYDLAGRRIDEIAFPSDGTTSLYARRSPAQRGIYYKYSSFVTPPATMKYDVANRSHQMVFAEKVPSIPNHVETRMDTFRSADGSQVPICIAWDPQHVLPDPAPLIYTGYGGFGISLKPAYSTFVTFLMQIGCRFAFANVRGGSERGSQWYESGRRRNKQNSVTDFISGAEWLISNGLTIESKLASFGGSSGGLLVMAAMTQRPELFRAVLCIATLLDMLRYHKFDLTYRWIDEYGCSDNIDDFRSLLAYSPYHRVRKGVVYPSVLFVSGDVDNRSNPLHIRKMAARLQMEGAKTSRVLVDLSPFRGHSPTMPLTVRVESLSDRLSFICRELEIPIREDCSPFNSCRPADATTETLRFLK